MAEEYKVELGINLNTSNLKSDIAKLDDKHKIKVGINLGVDDIRKRISAYNKNTNNAKLHLKISLDTDDLKRQINKLDLTGKGIAIPVNTESLKDAFNEVKSSITEIKNSLGTLDDKANTKSLVAAVNQIANALEKATSESNGLVASLNALSKKDFSFNLNLKTGNANPIKAMTDYGQTARRETIPALQEQVNYLKKLLGGTDEADKALEKYLVKLHKGFEGVSAKKRLESEMVGVGSDGKSISDIKRMSAYEQYVDYLKQIASLNGIKLDGFNAQFSKAASEMVDDTVKIQSGVKETEEQFERLKSIFNTGIDADSLNGVLEPITTDLAEIKKAFESLSSIGTVDGLTTSFKELAESLDKLTSNINLFKDALDSGLSININGNNTFDQIEQESNASTNVVVQNEERKQQAIRQTQRLISDAAQRSINDVTSRQIGRYFEIDKSDSNNFNDEMDNLVRKWTNNKGSLVDVKISTRTSYDKEAEKNIERLHQAQVTYNNELGETIQKTIAWRKIGEDFDADGKKSPVYGFAEVSGRYSKSIGQTTNQADAFVKQQKNAVANLTNQINQLNRAANDQNAPRAIKDESHIDAIRQKYNDVVVAIQRMENASSDTFVDEQNNVKRLISEYKSLVSEMRNVENVATSLRSKDIDTVKKTYESKLDVLISKMKSAGVYDSDFEEGISFNNQAEKIRSNLLGATDASGLVAFLNELDKLEAGYKRADAAAKEFNRSQKVGINVSGLESKIADIQRISPEIDQFKTKVNGAEVTVESLIKDLKNVKTQGDFSVVNSRFKAFTDAAKAAGIAVSEVATKVKSVDDIKLDIKLGNYDNQISQMDDRFNSLSYASDELYDSVTQVHSAYEALESALQSTGDEVADRERLIQAEKEYAEALERTNNLLKIQAREEKRNVNKEKLDDDIKLFQSEIDAWLVKNSAATRKFSGTMLDLKAKAEGVDRVTLNGLVRQFKLVDKEAEKLGLKTLSVFDRFKNKFKEYMSYLSAAEIFMWAEQGLRDMFEQVKLIDSAMTELKKVTDETDAAYSQFLSNAADKAKEIGTTIDGLVSSTADFARLGYDFKDAQGLAEVANIYAVVGDEIEGVEGATESLISTMTAFKDEMNGMSNTDFAMSIIDKFNEIGNNFAISSGGIGEALERSASSLMAANNTIDESIALITAANTVVQDPEQVGTAFKTISMRIRGAKTELEEAGLETEGMVESTAKLRSEIMALTGVDIMDGANKFKSTYQIMDELADKWQDLSDIQQATVTEIIAGKRQGNIVSSLMTNFDTARYALETSLNSAGSAMAEHEKWQQSLEAQILSLKASWQSLSQSFLSSNFLKIVLDGVINLVDGLTKLIDTFGALPTLMGTVATGLSIFKNTGFLSVLNKDISGAQKQLALFGKSFKDISRDFASGQSLFKSLFSNSITKADVGYITEYFNQVKSGVSVGQAYANTLSNASVAGKQMAVNIRKGAVSMDSLKTATIGGKAALFGLEVAATAANIALTMGISLAIQGIVNLISGWVNANKELAEQVDEITSKFKEQSNELKKLKGDYDASNESSMISKYDRLSKGVDNLGRNVSLTSDEYLEYQSIVNQIAEQIPSLVSGYDSQGNALLSCKDNVEELTTAYENLIKTQNNEIFSNAGKIGKDFANTVEDNNSYGFWGNNITEDAIKALETVLNEKQSAEQISKYFEDRPNEFNAIKNALLNAGVIDSKFITGNKFNNVLADTIKNNPNTLKSIIDDFNAGLEEDIAEMKSIAQATLSDAFDLSDSEFYDMSDNMQGVVRNIVDSFDYEFYKQYKDNPLGVQTYINNMLEQLRSLSDVEGTTIDTAFNLKTQFNNGEISYGEYVSGLENAGKAIDKLDLDPEIESQLKLSIGLDEEGFVEEYKKLRNRLASDDFDIMSSDYIPFIESLSSEELSVLWKVIPELEETDYKETIADVKAALEKEMMLQGLTFDLNLEVEAAGLEALNTALAESVSATGLSSDSINALKGRYADLEAQGYDLSSMFEETSTGIRLNRQEFNKLENAYATDKLVKIDGDLNEMKLAYDDLGEAIKNCDDPVRKSELFNERQTLANRISEAATLAHQYKGLTSAYNDWLSAEEAGQERDMYENIIKGFETVDDEISRGWIDDGTIEFLELLTGKTDLAGKSGKQLKEIYDGLDGAIKNTTYSIRDFFTVDEDGNSTNTGVYNFLDAIGQLEEEKFKGKDIVKRDKGGNIIGFDFELAGGDEVIAEALGVSEELVQIMVRAADDAGFVVSMDGTYRQLADLQNEAKAAADYLHKIGKTDFEFDFNTTSVENLKTQLEEAHKILDDKKFWNKDGTFNFNADGATQAMQVVSTLQAKLDKLTEEKYGIGLTVEDEEFEEPLENLQDYGRKVATLNQLELNPKANSEEIEKINGELDEIAEYFANLDGDLKVQLGFESDDGIEDVKKKIETGEVKIPTVLDIQANMDKNIEKLADLAWLKSNLLSDKEEETIRKKYNIEIEADKVDTSDVEEKVENAVHGGGGGKFGHGGRGGKFELSREANIEIIANTFGIEDVDDLTSKLKGLDDKTVEAVAKVIGQTNVELLRNTIAKLKPNEVEAIAKAIGQGDVDALQEAIKNVDSTYAQAIAEAFGYDDVNDLCLAIDDLDPKTVEAVANALGITDVENLKGAIDNVQGKDVEVNATTSGESKLSGLKSIIDSIKSKTVTVTSWFKKIFSGGSTRNDSNGFSDVNGTANVDGTTGRAFKQGSWGTKDSGNALVGELGTEVLVRDGKYYTIGDNGAEFIKYKKGDIIFNHKQTEELFANGKVTSNGGRGKAFSEGTAFSRGSGGIGKITSRVSAVNADGEVDTKITKKSSKKKTVVTTTIEEESSSTGSGSSSGSSGSGGGVDKVDGQAVGTDKNENKFEEAIDWIEIILDRAERAIDKYEQQSNNVYKTWAKRNKALENEINQVSSTISLYEKAKNQYLSEANSVGLSESYASKVRNGSLSVEDFKGESDEKLVKKIKNYQDLYDKYLNCVDKINELKEQEASLYSQRFENVQSEYDNLLQGFDHTESMLNEYISQAEEKGYIVSKNYYDALIDNEEDRISTLKQEQSALIKARDEAVANGEFDKYSEEW